MEIVYGTAGLEAKREQYEGLDITLDQDKIEALLNAGKDYLESIKTTHNHVELEEKRRYDSSNN